MACAALLTFPTEANGSKGWRLVSRWDKTSKRGHAAPEFSTIPSCEALAYWCSSTKSTHLFPPPSAASSLDHCHSFPTALPEWQPAFIRHGPLLHQIQQWLCMVDLWYYNPTQSRPCHLSSFISHSCCSHTAAFLFLQLTELIPLYTLFLSA